MTIGEYVRRRGQRDAIVQCALIVGLVLVRIFASEKWISYFLDGSIVVAMVAWYFSASTKCPKCNRSLGNVALKAAMPFNEPIDQCPFCGARFNEPMPEND